MKKIALIAFTLSLISSASFAQTTPPVDSTVQPVPAPAVVIAGGVGVGGIVLATFGLLLLAGLGGGGGGSSSSSSSSSSAQN